MSMQELHSEISDYTDAQKSCKEILKMSPPNSQIQGAFMLGHKSISTALNLRGSASCAMGTEDIAVKDVGPPIPLPSGTVPKRFKSKHKATSTLSKPTEVVPTGIVAHEGAEPVMEPQGTQGKGAAKPGDPDDLEVIGDEELEGLKEVDEPEEESKLANMK